MDQSLSQDFKIKCPKWTVFGHRIFQGRQKNTEVTAINMYLVINIRHNIIIQCMGILLRWKNLNYMLEIWK